VNLQLSLLSRRSQSAVNIISNVILGNEKDLSSAQQMESQTKLRVETIEHEMSMEMTRHVDAIAMIESKAKESDDTNVKTLDLIKKKKVMIETKKEELNKIWMVSFFVLLPFLLRTHLVLTFILPFGLSSLFLRTATNYASQEVTEPFLCPTGVLMMHHL
jgi:hypothetical protein